MATGFRPAYTSSGKPPSVVSYAYTAAQTFIRGEPLIFASGGAGTVEVDTTNPTPIVGVAAEAAASRPGNSPGFAVAATTGGNAGKVSIWSANRDTVFMGTGTTDPLTTHLDTVYGLNVASGVWTIDITDTTNTRVEIVEIDTDENLFFFKFMEAHLALP